MKPNYQYTQILNDETKKKKLLKKKNPSQSS
jgi:hypothetical protein